MCSVAEAVPGQFLGSNWLQEELGHRGTVGDGGGEVAAEHKEKVENTGGGGGAWSVERGGGGIASFCSRTWEACRLPDEGGEKF